MRILAMLAMVTFVASCGFGQTEIEEVERVEIRTVPIQPSKPIVPDIDQVQMRDVDWTILTPDNVEEKMEEMGANPVFFALTADGYENISLNLSDIRAMVEQQQRVIALYEEQFE